MHLRSVRANMIAIDHHTVTLVKRTGRHLPEATSRQRLLSVRPVAMTMAKVLCFGLLAAFLPPFSCAADDITKSSNSVRTLSTQEGATVPPTIEKQPVPAPRPKRANFKREHKSQEARHVADWVVDSGDNHSMPFVIVDKTDAKVFVFDADGRLRGAAPALLGLARGDDSVPGIGDRELSERPPRGAHDAGGPLRRRTGPQFRRKGHSLGGLRRCRFHASGGYEQPQGAPPAALGHSDAARQPYFLWLHQCSGEVLR